MANQLDTFLKNPTNRHYVRVVAFVVLGISIGALLADVLFFQGGNIIHRDIKDNALVTSEGSGDATSAYTIDPSRPTHLSVPTVGIEADFEAPLGLNADRTIQVPKSFEKLGWYRYSPTPGELGPAVILGHVDSYQGPAVFFPIGQLEEGDPIEITREDGSVAAFEVTGIARYEQEGFPSHLVYGDIDHAGLRLVTCSGTFDHGTQKYSHNTVVYAKLVEPESAPENQ